MDNIGLIFNYNRDKVIAGSLKKGRMVYTVKNSEIGGKEVRDVIRFINSVHNKYTKVRIPITLNFINVSFVDKLTYIMLECICLHLLKIDRHPLKLNIVLNRENTTVFTNGITSSPLQLIAGKRSKKSISLYPQKFASDLYGNHYRKVFEVLTDVSSSKLGNIMNDIRLFLKNLDVSEECSIEMSETITELIGNAVEHAETECLVDIDVANNLRKKSEDDKAYYSVNIVVLNFSDKLLGDFLKSKMKNNELTLNDRYNSVKVAYVNHSQSFCESYSENDFYKIASFQHKISGTESKLISGGKGLTQLIKSLESRSDMHACYMMSGNRVLNFIHEYLAYNAEYWIGFNEENDFIKNIPAENSIDFSAVYLPGTAYNLNFVMRKEDNDEK